MRTRWLLLLLALLTLACDEPELRMYRVVVDGRPRNVWAHAVVGTATGCVSFYENRLHEPYRLSLYLCGVTSVEEVRQ